jgi:hypothetical protein
VTAGYATFRFRAFTGVHALLRLGHVMPSSNTIANEFSMRLPTLIDSSSMTATPARNTREKAVDYLDTLLYLFARYANEMTLC